MGAGSLIGLLFLSFKGIEMLCFRMVFMSDWCNGIVGWFECFEILCLGLLCKYAMYVRSWEEQQNRYFDKAFQLQ